MYTIQNETTHKFPVHKAILHARCDYLSRYITEILICEDIRDESGIQMVKMHGIDHHLLKAILVYLYTDKVKILSQKIDELSVIGLNYGLVRLHSLQPISSCLTIFFYIRIIFMRSVSIAMLKYIIPYMILIGNINIHCGLE